MGEDALNNKKLKILCVTTFDKRYGTGHLKRTLRLLNTLGDKGYLFIPSEQAASLIRFLGSELAINEQCFCHQPAQEGPWDLVVLDNCQTSLAEAEEWLSLARVVALDEGGPARAILPYLIDTLPILHKVGLANESDTGYLNVPPFAGERAYPPKNILITFGGVDQAQLTERIGLLFDNHGIPAEQWRVVKGPFFNRTFAWPGVKILQNPCIADILPEYDLIITHFGLTAFEAVASGANVVVFNPTVYHEQLSRLAGFPSLGVKEINKNLQDDFFAYLKGEKTNHTWQHHVTLGAPKDLTKRLCALAGEKAACPACLHSQTQHRDTVIFRSKEKNYAQCRQCGLIYQECFSPTDINYDHDYFFKNYKEQYGCTYLEDFDHICQLCGPRVKRIQRCIKNSKPSLLEIGCAYGAFLQVAHKAGFHVRGIEVNHEAAQYVRTKLHLPVVETSFPDTMLDPDKQFDVVALWYVLEHFKNLDIVLQRISSLLKPGGLLAFSTPMGDGLTGTMAPEQFFQASPADHYSIFTRKNVRSLLARYGFKVVHIEITGVHPERKNSKLTPGSRLYKFYTWWYKLRKMGDTFEVYAIKKEQ